MAEGLPNKRSAARSAGAPYYFTGVPCKRGHVSRRFADSGDCVDCNYERQRAAYASDPKRASDYRKEYNKRHPEVRKASFKRYYDANVDKMRKRARDKRLVEPAAAKDASRRSYQNHKEKKQQYAREYRAKYPEKRLALQNQRRARQLGAEGHCTPQEAAAIRAAQKDRCAYCKTHLRGGGHLDHIQALTKGGANWPRNMQWLCAPCNISKHDDDPIAFAKRKGFLL